MRGSNLKGLPGGGAKSAEDARLDELVAAIDRCSSALGLQNKQMERLVKILEVAVSRSPALAASAGAEVVALPEPETAKQAKSSLKLVNWVIGPPDNIEWAYGNNAKRLSLRLKNYQHAIGKTDPSAVAVYFDALVADRFKVESRYSILRIGGPRPLDRLFGDDIAKMRAFFAQFQAVIALNGALYLRASQVHSNVFLIPNALDLSQWKPVKSREDRPFTVGFAASMKSSAEAEMKGAAIAQAAASRVGAKLLLTSKGGNQLPHDKMYSNFYSKIDALIHPVGPGREGTSNVIMEALASGVPVITTVHSGYHGEFLVDGRNALIRERNESMFAEAIALLQRDERLRNRLSAEGRAFAEQHHNIETVAQSYGKIIAEVMRAKPKGKAQAALKIAFVPFWEPPENFGSSRLRAKVPAEYLTASGRHQVVNGYAADADIAVIVQCCSDQRMAELNENKGQFVIYDVCDRYYENPRLFKHLEPPVDSQKRFFELAERADLITVSSKELKAEIASRLPHKPVRYIPEPVDYGAAEQAPRVSGPKNLLWFGNPGRGNWESAQWIIERLRDQHGYKPLIVSQKSFFKKYPDFEPMVREWSVAEMEKAFAEADLCVVAYDKDEQQKSPNRFIAAMMHGIPTIVTPSAEMREILGNTGHEFAVMREDKDVDKAVGKLRSDDFRKLYVTRVQRYLASIHGQAAITQTYLNTFGGQTFKKELFAKGPRKIAFVSHNLSLGEGAPWSLFELINGLRDKGIEPHVYSAAPGPLLAQYNKAGINVEIFDPNARHVVKIANTRYPMLKKAFITWLKKNGIEAVVANTVKASPFVDFANGVGIPGAVIVRESYQAHERFDYFFGDARLSAMRGLTAANEIVFVANTSREIWKDQPFAGTVSVIPNGVSPDRFGDDARLTKAQARERLGLPQDAVIALCVGTINERKGQGELTQAFSELPPETQAKAHMVFLGAVENAHIANYRHTLATMPEHTRSQITVVNATEDVAPWYAAADFFLMNSNSEAYPRSVVEGLYFGLPVLSTPVFGVKEQVQPGVSGFLYDYNDMAAWRGYFTQLVENGDLRTRMSADARKAFWKLTGYNEMLLSYKTIIARMLG